MNFSLEVFRIEFQTFFHGFDKTLFGNIVWSPKLRRLNESNIIAFTAWEINAICINLYIARMCLPYMKLWKSHNVDNVVSLYLTFLKWTLFRLFASYSHRRWPMFHPFCHCIPAVIAGRHDKIIVFQFRRKFSPSNNANQPQQNTFDPNRFDLDFKMKTVCAKDVFSLTESPSSSLLCSVFTNEFSKEYSPHFSSTLKEIFPLSKIRRITEKKYMTICNWNEKLQ